MTWSPVAREFERRGREVVVPSLLGLAPTDEPQWRHAPEAVRAATASVAAPIVLVGHSGAGLLLPTIADALTAAVAALIFVDSFLPPPSGTVTLTPPGSMDELRALASDEVLPPWSSWFGEETMRELVPDDQLRRALEDEMPRMPLSYFDAVVPLPDGWDASPCAYLLLAREPYGESAADAKDRGWPVADIPGTQHLAMVTEPIAIADALLRLERTLAGSA
jgi:Alpha/beta hydrolase family